VRRREKKHRRSSAEHDRGNDDAAADGVSCPILREKAGDKRAHEREEEAVPRDVPRDDEKGHGNKQKERVIY